MPSSRVAPARTADEDWLAYIYNQLGVSRGRGSALDKLRDRVDFITFNYDRSLEAWIRHCLINDEGKSSEQAGEMLRRFRIVHPHGRIGSQEYGEPVPAKDLRRAAEELHLIFESNVTEGREYVEARRLLQLADDVCFVGFGYHRDNILRLGISAEWPKGTHRAGIPEEDVLDMERKKIPNVYGTTLGLTKEEIQRAQSHFEYDIQPQFRPELNNLTSAKFFRSHEVMDRILEADS